MKGEYANYVAAAFLIILWTGLVWFNHADPELINEIKAMLVAIGVVHGCTNLQRVPSSQGGGSGTSSNPPAKESP